MSLVAPSFTRHVHRLHDEFYALPGLTLTVPQVVRLLDVDEREAVALLKELVEEGFLVRASGAIFKRSIRH